MLLLYTANLKDNRCSLYFESLDWKLGIIPVRIAPEQHYETKCYRVVSHMNCRWAGVELALLFVCVSRERGALKRRFRIVKQSLRIVYVWRGKYNGKKNSQLYTVYIFNGKSSIIGGRCYFEDRERTTMGAVLIVFDSRKIVESNEMNNRAIVSGFVYGNSD